MLNKQNLIEESKALRFWKASGKDYVGYINGSRLASA